MRTRRYSKANVIMWIISLAGLIIFIIFLVFTYTNSNPKNNEYIVVENDTIKNREFILPIIPSELTVPHKRANFMVTHYWDNFDFSDTAYIHLPKITEQAFINYIEILPHADKPTGYFSIKNMLLRSEDASDRMHGYLLNIYKKYLYDPNSPLRNDEYYIPVLNHIIKSDKTEDADRERAKFNLNLLLKNRIGQKATDITYTLASGKTGRLYNIKRNYTLLYFYNPDCNACEQISRYMQELDLIKTLIENKALCILMIYPDKNLVTWKKHLHTVPETWINGYDKNTLINDKQLYDLKAIPTLYLLDKDKTVVLKDADVDKIIEYLQMNELK